MIGTKEAAGNDGTRWWGGWKAIRADRGRTVSKAVAT